MVDVSVIIGTYNHEKFVEAAVRSVLDQNDVNFEVLIGDDGSMDETAAVVRSIRDDRISFEAFDENRGAVNVLNELIAKARGKYIAIMNSDDIWLSCDKLKNQVAILENEPNLAATFGGVKFIDREGSEIEKSELPFGSIFDQENRSQAMWIKTFFESGNCLCHPSVLIRRSVLDEVGLYDQRLRQLPDFDMWMRIVKLYPIHVSSKKLVGFRILPGENASAPTPVNILRSLNEQFLIIGRFFDDLSLELFRGAFQDKLVQGDVDSALKARIEAALLMLRKMPNSLGPAYQVAGMLAMNKLLGDPVARTVLLNEYDFDDHAFHRLTGVIATLNSAALEEQIGSANSQIQILEEEVNALRAERDHQVIGADEKIAELRSEVTRLTASCNQLDVHRLHSEGEIIALRASTSWKITRPLRVIGALILKLRRILG